VLEEIVRFIRHLSPTKSDPIFAAGQITSMDAGKDRTALLLAGGGRTSNDKIDLAVGISGFEKNCEECCNETNRSWCACANNRTTLYHGLPFAEDGGGDDGG